MIKPMSLQEVQEITGGEVFAEAEVAFTHVSIDTRTLQPGDLFIAINGPHHDGNAFVELAKKNQAVAAITSKELTLDLPMLKVSDTRLALGKIAAKNRENSVACVIALTGSQGKTTVKEMTAEILSNCGDVIYTQGNLNNDYGVPLSLLKIEAQHEFAVIELGASGPGEIAYCAALTKPQIAHITNVASTHLEGFGDLDGVANAKGELWDYLPEGGVAVINIDDDFADQWAQRAREKTHLVPITISAMGNKAADYFVSELSFNEDLSSDFNLNTPLGQKHIHLNLAGQHNAMNALAAAALSMEAGASLNDVHLGLHKVRPVAGRLASKRGHNSSTIIDDSYNASPASFKAAIDVLSALPGKRIIVIGDMGELGLEAESVHKEIGRYAKEKGINEFFATGELSQLAADSFGEGAVFSLERDSLAGKIISKMNKDVVVLVKGSRSAGMDKLVKLLVENEG